jgi:mercuric ion transport protein
MKRILGLLAFLGSSGTLFCCVIPVLLAAVGGGVAVSAFVSAFPWLVPLSQHKGWLFGVAGLLLFLNGFFVFRPDSKLVCSVTGGGICKTSGVVSKVLFVIAVIFYSAGSFTAYLLTPILRFFER